MKIDKQLPTVPVPAINPHDRRTPTPSEIPTPQVRRRAPVEQPRVSERRQERAASFNLQLNRQLSSMQLAERYLADLENRLAGLKFSFGRQLSAAEAEGKKAIKEAIKQVTQVLEQRAQRSGGALDPTLKLSLNEPARTRFRLQGLDSIEAIKQSGKETLVFRGGRHVSEPMAVLLDDNMSEQQILRRFNATLGHAGVRAELDMNGELMFSARESDWEELKEQLAVRGEGKLFPKEEYSRLPSHVDQLLALPEDPQLDSQAELRRLLDSVLAALDKVSALREQLLDRQKEIREFLARHANQDEKEWARNYASSAFKLMTRQPPSYATVTQTVLAQVNISRYAVVSLLS